MKVNVSVQFSGEISVEVPDHLSARDARLLAEKVAAARIVATCDNPDAPEDDACTEYAEACSKAGRATAERDWDRCEILGVGGTWLASTRSGERLRRAARDSRH
jgi:hypothetical protein